MSQCQGAEDKSKQKQAVKIIYFLVRRQNYIMLQTICFTEIMERLNILYGLNTSGCLVTEKSVSVLQMLQK